MASGRSADSFPSLQLEGRNEEIFQILLTSPPAARSFLLGGPSNEV